MVVMFSLQPLSAKASDEETPYLQDEVKIPGQGGGAKYTDLQRYSVNTSVSGKTVYSELAVYTKNGATNSSGTMYLQRKNGYTWETVASWSVSGQGSFSVQ